MSILVGEPLFFALTLYIVRKNFMYLKLWINYACFRRKCHILLGNMMMVWAFFPPRRFLMKTTTFGPQSSSIVQLISVETFPSVSCSPVIIISDVKAESHPARQWHYLIHFFQRCTKYTHCFLGIFIFSKTSNIPIASSLYNVVHIFMCSCFLRKLTEKYKTKQIQLG